MQWRIALSADRVHIYEGDKLRNWTLAETKEVLSSRLSVQEAERLIEQLQRTGEVQIEIPEA